MKYITLTLFVFMLSGNIFAQKSNEASSYITVKKSNISPKLKYLFDKYGIVQSEQICLNQYAYEEKHNVIVLFGNKYEEAIAKYTAQINQTSDPNIILHLEDKKNRTLNFFDIEPFLIN